MYARCRLAAAITAIVLATGASWTPAAAAEPSAAPLGSGAGPAGRWEGAIQLPGQELRVTVELTRDGDTWSGKIDIPAQGAKGLPLQGIAVEGSRVTFLIVGVPGDPKFRGALSADGASIRGDFTQSGQTFPFRLERGGDPAKAAAQSLEGFGDLARRVLADWKVPGLSVAVVKDGRVILLEGYGQRDVGKRLPVTPDTLFAVGSTTKAMTAALLATLVEEGKLAWDAPVADALPAFRLKDEIAARRMTPRDLVTHRSGLPRHDMVWYNAALSRQEMFDRLRFLEPSADLRVRFQYQNLMFLAAGHLAAEVGGAPWEDLMRRRLFEPLKMAEANLSVSDSQRSADHALPYKEKNGTVQAIPFRNISAMGPAGSVNASARAMGQWLLFNLGHSETERGRVLSAPALAELHTLQMATGNSSTDPEAFDLGYAMGWFVESYRGRIRLHHGGAIDGFRAMVSFVPGNGVGAVALCNLDGPMLPVEALVRTAIDRTLGLEPIDWNARFLERHRAAKKAAEEAKKRATAERKEGTKPAHALAEYAGEYEHPAYGTIGVTVAPARGVPAAPGGAAPVAALRAEFHAIPMALEHWHFETFRALPEDPALADEKLFLQFLANAAGDVDRLSVPLEPQAPEIVFSKKPPARLSDPAFLKTLTGVYAMADNATFVATVEAQGNTLSVSVPGQPVYTLEPYGGTEFRLKGLTGYRMRFVLDEKGTVREILLIQPDGVFTLRRK
jgi:CubicO group peptidase (beta-lactamase class C family)